MSNVTPLFVSTLPYHRLSTTHTAVAEVSPFTVEG